MTTDPITSPVASRLDYAERWLRDGLAVLKPALAIHQISVDMTHALRRLEALRQDKVQASTTHLLVSAAARALAANPQLHQLVAGTRRHRPAHVNIGLSVTGETFVAPVLLIEDADRKSIPELAAETAGRTAEVRAGDQRMLGMLRRWGWMVPSGVLRRAILRLLFSSPGFRRKGVGSFQVSTVPVDWAASASFSAVGLLVGGQVRSRVVAVDGQPVVRPVMTLTLCSDHGVWDGRAAARFLAAVRSQLEADPGEITRAA
jgi:pyruvate dehydrogenase E2 component (dihydrolipoamide acetyltransferase)